MRDEVYRFASPSVGTETETTLYGRSGHLCERRYRAFLIRTEAALQSLVRHIHLNPVRAAIVDRPGAHPWSSYSAYSDSGPPGPSWLTRSFVLSLFGVVGDPLESAPSPSPMI